MPILSFPSLGRILIFLGPYSMVPISRVSALPGNLLEMHISALPDTTYRVRSPSGEAQQFVFRLAFLVMLMNDEV